MGLSEAQPFCGTPLYKFDPKCCSSDQTAASSSLNSFTAQQSLTRTSMRGLPDSLQISNLRFAASFCQSNLNKACLTSAILKMLCPLISKVEE